MHLHVVDGTYELYRAHFSKRPEHRVKATLGLISSMLGLLADEREAVTHLSIAFDNPIVSFRNELYDGYKTDEGVPPELRAQFDLAEEAMRALGLVVWSMSRFEADDAMATAAAKFKGEFDQVRILSPDKDLGQSVDGTRVVQVDRMRNKVIDEPALRALRGIAPRSIPDYLALVGDAADGFPGLRGIGERTATLLLARFPHLEDIPDDVATWPKEIRAPQKVAATLGEYRKEARLFRTLATLVEDVPLAESKEELAYRGAHRDAYESFCDRVGATNLRDRPTLWRASTS